jgi:predicted acyl esterase
MSAANPDEAIEVIYRSPLAPEDPKARVPGFSQSRTIFRAGYVHKPGALPLTSDLIVERDVQVRLGDGTAIYIDIFRPEDTAPLAALVAWSPYGKQGGALSLDDFPFRAGVPAGAVSGLEKFEGPDPAYWCPRGYAVVNCDARGIGRSEGDMPFWGSAEGRDGADVIEWIATQSWSNGKVGLTGNSWLALSQWFIAAQRPKHLAAIAPWEGVSDFYRETSMRGGIPDPGFNQSILDGLSGRGRIEDVPAMMAKYPLMNSYWQDKAAELDKIEVPAYVVASWTNPLHTRGTLEGFRRISTRQKWLRVHNTMEWPDYYTPANVEELRRFFDRYLRGVDNDWEATPRVRVSILDPGHHDEVNRAISSWPPNTEHTVLYLDAATASLRRTPPEQGAIARYDATDGKGRAVFDFRVAEDALDVLGYSSLRLWVSAEHALDMDLFVQITKHGRRGLVQLSPIVPLRNRFVRTAARLAYRAGFKKAGLLYFRGPSGRLRVSHRELDPLRSTESEPYLTHAREQPLGGGQIVPVDIALWPVGMRWHAGDILRLTVAGHDLSPSPLAGLQPATVVNDGHHIIHTGPDQPSRLIIPMKRAGAKA